MNNMDLKPMMPHSTIGILGGGQLALMLCDAAKGLGLPTQVFATHPDDPAISHAGAFYIGSFTNVEDLRSFFKRCDLVIFENEFIPAKVLNSAASSSGIPLYPNADTMALCADKLEQKLLFQRLGLPSAKFIHAGLDDDGKTFLASVATEFSDGFVLKWAKGGYDGGGVQVWDTSALDHRAAWEFITSAQKVGSRIYAEQRVAFDCEIALVAVRNKGGEFAAYPLVGTVQENQICTSVSAPVFPELQQEAATIARTLANELNFVGVFAIEFFVKEGKLLINEMAPRVHNSGHATMDGARTSQFENHLRAVTGMPFGDMSHKPRYGMINILGPEGYTGPLNPPSIIHPQVKVHWYYKRQSRPGRKIGHLNLWSEHDDECGFKEVMSACQSALLEWEHDITKGKLQ